MSESQARASYRRPPANQTVAQAIRDGVVVGKQRIDVKRARVRGIAQTTRDVPRARSKRGRHISAEDSAIATRLTRDIGRLGLDAKVPAKAGFAGKPGRLVINVAMSDVARLGRALCTRKSLRFFNVEEGVLQRSRT